MPLQDLRISTHLVDTVPHSGAVNVPHSTTGDVTYYVRTDGSDSNTGLGDSVGGAFLTIGKAVSMIPQVVNHVVTVNVAAGTYDETVLIQGYFGRGSITLQGASNTNDSANYSVVAIYVFNCANRVFINGFRLTTPANYPLYTLCSVFVDVRYCSTVVESGTYGFTINSSGLLSLNGCLISNRLAAVFCQGGTVYCYDISGTGNSYSYDIYGPGIIVKQNAGTVTGSANVVHGGLLINPSGGTVGT